jgi:hypothetical protein
MKPCFDPLQVFKTSKTPAGLYARQKWLGESNTVRWENDFKATVDILLNNQGKDGSWKESEVETINRLFGLHLTLREPNDEIEKALNWLLDKIDLQKSDVRACCKDNKINEKLEGLPFIHSNRQIFFISATLFLSSIFKRQEDPFVMDCYQRISSVDQVNSIIRTDPASLYNVLRALVVHPVYSDEKFISPFVLYFSNMQTSSGDWGPGMPFYKVLNALAHLDFPLASIQIEKAFSRLYDTQNKDGTWGDDEPEWNTFLAVHALKNKGGF